jgi:DNA-binding NarL/FixJ family response regulator
VVIAEDEPLIRRGIEAVLDGSDFTIIDSVGTAGELLAAVEAEAPGLVITDIRMPPEFTDEGLVAAMEIRRRWPATPVCVLSQHVLTRPARTLLEGGARAGVGYLLKQRVTHIERFLADLHRVVAGDVVLDPEVIEQLFDRAHSAGRHPAALTPRLREVQALVAEGSSHAAIADKLVVSEKTVVHHLTSIYSTLGLLIDDNSHRRVQAVLAYLSGR